MKRTLARLLVCVAVVAGLAFVPGNPARADTDVCEGTGAFNTDGDMTYTANTTRSFEVFIPSIGRCEHLAEFLYGSITGRCGLAVGSGYANARPEHTFDIFWIGNTLLLVGNTVTGAFVIAENPGFLPDNCVTGASSWLGPGALTITHLLDG